MAAKSRALTFKAPIYIAHRAAQAKGMRAPMVGFAMIGDPDIGKRFAVDLDDGADARDSQERALMVRRAALYGAWLARKSGDIGADASNLSAEVYQRDGTLEIVLRHGPEIVSTVAVDPRVMAYDPHAALLETVHGLPALPAPERCPDTAELPVEAPAAPVTPPAPAKAPRKARAPAFRPKAFQVLTRRGLHRVEWAPGL